MSCLVGACLQQKTRIWKGHPLESQGDSAGQGGNVAFYRCSLAQTQLSIILLKQTELGQSALFAHKSRIGSGHLLQPR